MIVNPPGGWCLDPWNNAAGVAAVVLSETSLPVLEIVRDLVAGAMGGTQSAVDKATAGLNTALAKWSPYARSLWPEYAELLYALWAPNAVLASQAAGGALYAAQAMQRIVSTRIPSAQAAAEAYAQAVADQVAAQAAAQLAQEAGARVVGDQSTLASAEAYTQAVGGQIVEYANELVQSEAAQRVQGDAVTLATARADIDALANYAGTQLTDVVTWADRAVAELVADLQSLEAYTTTELQAGQAYTVQAVHQAEQSVVTGLAGEVQTQLQPLWAGTAESMNRVTTTLVTMHPETAQNVSLVGTQTPVDAAVALAGVASMVRTLAITTTECTQPYCTEKNRLGKAAHTLANLLGLGGMLAFLVAAITEPEATAAASMDAIDAVEGLVRGAVEAVL